MNVKIFKCKKNYNFTGLINKLNTFNTEYAKNK